MAARTDTRSKEQRIDFQSLYAGSTNQCALAEAYLQWFTQLWARINENPTAAAVNVAKLRVVERYWEFYAIAPRRCRNHVGERSSHHCLFQVFKDAYAALHDVHLRLVNPPLVEPPPARAAPTLAQMLYLGEEDS